MSPEEIYETFPNLDNEAQAKFYAYLEDLSRPDVWAWEFLRVNKVYIAEWVTHADALKHLDGAPSPIFGDPTQGHQARRDELVRATIGASKWGLHHTYQDPRVRGDEIDPSALFWKPSLYEEHSPYLLREDGTPEATRLPWQRHLQFVALDLSQPIGRGSAQFEKLRKTFKEYRSKNELDDKERAVSMQGLPVTLRALHAHLCGKENGPIGRVLFPETKKPTNEAGKAVARGVDLMNSGYLRLISRAP